MRQMAAEAMDFPGIQMANTKNHFEAKNEMSKYDKKDFEIVVVFGSKCFTNVS